MKNLKIKPGSFEINELGENVRHHFSKKYDVSDNGINEITVTKTPSIGCKLILTKKTLMVHGTFPTKGKLLLALLILILGGIVIPMGIYIFFYKSKFTAIEQEVAAYISEEFPSRLA